jgi:hypothetical protein
MSPREKTLKRSLLGQLLPQAPGDDVLIAGLEVDGVDGNLIEVATLMGPLLHIDVGLTLGQCYLDDMA